MGRRGLRATIISACVASALVVTPVIALADPVGGATYDGRASDGAELTFTVSADASVVRSYRIINARGDTCTLYADEDAGSWPGAPINNNAFDYSFGASNSNFFRGTFAGSQTASGTFRLYDPATSTTPACDTGTVTWTASTGSRPSSGGSGGSGSGSGSGSGGSGGGSNGGGTGSGGHGRGRSTFATRVVLHRLSHVRLGGHLSSRTGACMTGRTVSLWRGTHRIARTKSRRGGAYTFRGLRGVRGKAVRASVSRLVVRAGICSAGTSRSIRG